MGENSVFLSVFLGSFVGALRWHQLDALWQALHGQADAGWYIYTIGERPPREAASREQLRAFIREIDALLRREHKEDYCGIVYTDDFQRPSLVKIYDPNNLGAVCGSSPHPPLPGWVLSLIPPVDLPTALPPPAARRRWWRRFLEVGQG